MSRIVPGAEIRWNVHSESNPEQHFYTIYIANRPELVREIWQRFQEHVNFTDESKKIAEGVIKKDLSFAAYQCLCYGKPPKDLNWQEVHQTQESRITRDRELRGRINDGLLNYIERYNANKIECNK